MKNDANKKNEAPIDLQPDQPEGKPSKDKPTKPLKPDSGNGKRIVRWMLWLIIVFGLGAAAVTVFLYVPLQQKLSVAEANLSTSGQKISDDEKKIESLTAQTTDLENKNKDTQSQLDQVTLRLALVNTKSDIMAASLAVSAGDPVNTRLSLEQATSDLQVLTSLIKDNNINQVLTTIQQRLEQVKTKLDSNLQAIQPDLNNLIDNLSKLEDTLKK